MSLIDLYYYVCEMQVSEEEYLLRIALARMLTAQLAIETRVMELKVEAIDKGDYYIKNGNIIIKDTTNDK